MSDRSHQHTKQHQRNENEMSFLEHLEALRWHLIRVLVAILCCAVLAFVGKYVLFHMILLAPTRADFLTYQWLCSVGKSIHLEAFCIEKMPFVIQSRRMSGQLTMHISAAIVAGLVLSFPYVFWELWRFLRPALRAHEKSLVRSTTLVASLLFFIGILFGYYILVPISIQFLANYQIDPSIVNQFDIISYISTVLLLLLCSGLIFQLPLIVYFLTKSGLISAEMMLDYKRHAILLSLVLGAMITPPDPFSQILVALPLVLLYFFSIFVARLVERSNRSLEAPAGKKYSP